MKTALTVLAALFGASIAKEGDYTETIIFQDDFDTLDMKTWFHEQTMSGGGNWEFEWYVNNRTNSFVRDSKLFLKPTMTDDVLGVPAMHTADVNIWGGSSVEGCTNNQFYGCERNAAGSGNVINPVRSARVRTMDSVKTKYGRVEVRAKLPKGDWLWPAIWMLPRYDQYGTWPVSGEIDIVESRGNGPEYTAGGNNQFASTLHWGPDFANNQYNRTHEVYNHPESLNNDFHTYGLYWDSDGLFTYFEDSSKKVLQVDFTKQSFWERGEFPQAFNNPWEGQGNAAPFNQEFYVIFNVACGGTNGYFPDGVGGKPWADADSRSVNAFYNAKGTWFETWQGDDAALQIDSIKVWSLTPKSEKPTQEKITQ